MNRKWLSRCVNAGFLVVGALAVAGSGGLGGCSSKSSPSSPSPDTDGASSGASSDSGYGSSSGNDLDGATTIFSGAGGPVELPADAATCPGDACNGLVITDAPVVEETLVPGSPPAFTGGTLADGTYYLTSVAIYGGSVVSDVTEEAGFGDANGDGAIGDGASGAISDGAITDGASAVASDSGTSIGTPNGNFVEEVFSLSATESIAQIASANASGCTVGSVHVSTSGNVLSMIPFCGNPFNPTETVAMMWPYTATPTAIMASVPVGGGATAVLTLTLATPMP